MSHLNCIHIFEGDKTSKICIKIKENNEDVMAILQIVSDENKILAILKNEENISYLETNLNRNCGKYFTNIWKYVEYILMLE